MYVKYFLTNYVFREKAINQFVTSHSKHKTRHRPRNWTETVKYGFILLLHFITTR